MPSVKYLDIKIFGDQEVRRQLFRGQQAAGDMRPALEDVADDMMSVIGANFSSQGRRGGGSWKMLDPEWLKRKTKMGQSPLILIGWGALHDSMTQRGDPDQILSVTRNGIKLSSALDYAYIHTVGGGPSNLPKRDYLQWMTSDRTRWVRICEEHILSAMGGLRR